MAHINPSPVQSGTYVPQTQTLAALGNYQIKANQAGGVGQPFGINFDTSSVFGASVVDPILRVGINMGPGNGDARYNTAASAVFLQMEGDFNPSGQDSQECHLIMTNAAGTQTRLFSWTHNNTTGQVACTYIGDQWVFQNQALTSNTILKTAAGTTELDIDATGSASLFFMTSGVQKWGWELLGNGHLYLQDVASAGQPNPFEIVPGTTVNGQIKLGSVLFPVQAPTSSAPAYVKGGVYFDTTLNKLRIGGATAWETVTSA